MSTSNNSSQPNTSNISDILDSIERNRLLQDIQSRKVNIWLGRTLVYSQVSGQSPTRNELTLQKISLIQNALNEPSSFRGSLRIYLGNSVEKNKVFHVKHGQLVLDSLNLSKQATARNSQAKAPEAVSQPRTPPTSERPLTEVERLTARVEALETLVERQSKQLEALERQVMAAKMRSPVTTPDRSFQRWLSKLEEVGNRFLNQLLERFQSIMRETRSEMQALVGGLHQQTKAQIADLKNNLSQYRHPAQQSERQPSPSPARSADSQATATKAAAVEAAPIESIAARAKTGQVDSGLLWEHYNRLVVTEIPSERSLSVARLALQDSMTDDAISGLLERDPEVARINQQSGPGNAEKYKSLVLAAAHRVENRVRNRTASTERQPTREFQAEA